MASQGFSQTLVSSQVDGPAYGNSNTANTPISPGSAAYVLPSNFFYIGKTLRVKAQGRVSCTGTVTLNVGIALGTIATPIIVFAGGANTLVSATKTNVTIDIEMDITCRAIGSSTATTFMGIGKLTSEAALGSAANVAVVSMLPLSAPAVGAGCDVTLTQTIQLVATWGTAAAGNTITIHRYTVEDLN